MIRGVDQAGVLVQKDGLCLLEGNTVLYQVGSSLAAIPGKSNIAHSIILAIRNQLVLLAIHGTMEAGAEDMRDFHLPLPEQCHSQLRAESEGAQAPGTEQPLRKARHDQIAAYAAEMAGTDLDLDPDLEAAGIESLVKTGETAK